MEFVALVENMKKAFSYAERALGKSSHLPILSSFLVTAEKNKVTVQATNLEIGITTSFAAKTESEGSITIPAKPLLAFLGQINDAKITCTLDGKTMRMHTDSYKAQFQGQGVDDFPIIPKISAPNGFQAESAFFSRVLEQVVPSASVSDLRPELSSVFVRFEPGDGMICAATDTFRLAEKTIPLSELRTKIDHTLSCLIPLRTAQEAIRIAKEKLEPVEILIDESQIAFVWKETSMVSRLLEGEFPEYKAVIPKTFMTEASVSRQRFMEAIKVTGVFSSRLNDVKLKIVPKTKEVLLSAADASIGENEAHVQADAVSGDEIDAVFNYRYLIDGIASLDAKDALDIGFGGQDKPMLMRSHGDSSYLYILMPLRI